MSYLHLLRRNLLCKKKKKKKLHVKVHDVPHKNN